MNDIMDILSKGVADFHSEKELRMKLEKSEKTGKPLIIKTGFDPTSSDIHFGHTVLFNKMRQFQDAGHRVAYVVGDATAMIGDPSGRSKTRKQLSREEIQENARTYAEQAFKILDREKTDLVYNSSWLFPMNFADIIGLSSKYNVARMLERDDFSKRFKDNKPIAIHEFMYPLAQAYDSVMLENDVELGGTDQIFNLLLGRKIQQDYGQEQQVVMTLPLLIGLDGKRKMSKSYDNYIGVSEPPDTMFAKIMSISDELMWNYYELLTDESPGSIVEIQHNIKNGRMHPKDCKEKLAIFLTKRFHGQTAAEEAKRNFYSDIPSNLAEYKITLPEEGVQMAHIMCSAGMSGSNSQARRLIKQRAVSVEGEKIEDPFLTMEKPVSFILKVGKKQIKKIILTKD